MELILQRDDLQDTFESKWDSCVNTILKYAVSHKSPSKAVVSCAKDDGQLT